MSLLVVVMASVALAFVGAGLLMTVGLMACLLADLVELMLEERR